MHFASFMFLFELILFLKKKVTENVKTILYFRKEDLIHEKKRYF